MGCLNGSQTGWSAKEGVRAGCLRAAPCCRVVMGWGCPQTWASRGTLCGSSCGVGWEGPWEGESSVARVSCPQLVCLSTTKQLVTGSGSDAADSSLVAPGTRPRAGDATPPDPWSCPAPSFCPATGLCWEWPYRMSGAAPLSPPTPPLVRLRGPDPLSRAPAGLVTAVGKDKEPWRLDLPCHAPAQPLHHCGGLNAVASLETSRRGHAWGVSPYPWDVLIPFSMARDVVIAVPGTCGPAQGHMGVPRDMWPCPDAYAETCGLTLGCAPGAKP